VSSTSSYDESAANSGSRALRVWSLSWEDRRRIAKTTTIPAKAIATAAPPTANPAAKPLSDPFDRGITCGEVIGADNGAINVEGAGKIAVGAGSEAVGVENGTAIGAVDDGIDTGARLGGLGLVGAVTTVKQSVNGFSTQRLSVVTATRGTGWVDPAENVTDSVQVNRVFGSGNPNPSAFKKSKS
jgi:hypothetical protein